MKEWFGGFRPWLGALRESMVLQMFIHSHERGRSHRRKGPGRMRYNSRANPAGSKLWRKAQEGKL